MIWRKGVSVWPEGVVVASDRQQEWLLPWWWENYRKENNYPVTFVDLGLSPEGRVYCQQHGEVIAIHPDADCVDDVFLQKWEECYQSKEWRSKRQLWHAKPMALLQANYEKSIWLDLDCEVRGSLSPIFEQIESNCLLLCPEPIDVQEMDRMRGELLPQEELFNSGVMGFTRDSIHIVQWAMQTKQEKSRYFGDQNLLSRLIYERNWPVKKLSSLYNWRYCGEIPPTEVVVIHWVGQLGKWVIAMQMANQLPQMRKFSPK